MIEKLIKELEILLKSQKDSDYTIIDNTNNPYERYGSDADILIFTNFNCNIYYGPRVGWNYCKKCHCNPRCCIPSKVFEDLITKYGFIWKESERNSYTTELFIGKLIKKN